MDTKLALSYKAVISKTFKKAIKGYDALDVDEFFDRVALDYRQMESMSTEIKPYIAQLETMIKMQKDKIGTLEIENAKLQKRLGNIKDDAQVSSQNIEYLKRIDVLEKELYRLGKDPSKLK